MDYYPDFRLAIGSSCSVDLGIIHDTMINGSNSSSSNYVAKKKSFKISHIALSESERENFEYFVDTHFNTKFYFIWKDQVTYVVKFGQSLFTIDPRLVRGGVKWDIKNVELIEQ